MIYTIKRIDETDYGCEGRPDGTPPEVILTLVDEHGEEMECLAEDNLLYQRSIKEGDKIYFDSDGCPAKVLDENWTKQCGNVDLAAFVDKMEAAKAGRKVDWKCPFCGGNVGLKDQSNGHTVICCDQCDMRIDLENNCSS